ncbi:MAG: hypothetical protein GYA57_04750 [Myxococcales bacterium]|nr:hypothetical protein [Myxococcales bacterium]
MKRMLAVLIALVAALMVLGGCVVRAHTAPPPRAVVVAQPAPARAVVVAQPAPQPVYVAPAPAQPAGPPPPTVVY